MPHSAVEMIVGPRIMNGHMGCTALHAGGVYLVALVDLICKVCIAAALLYLATIVT